MIQDNVGVGTRENMTTEERNDFEHNLAVIAKNNNYRERDILLMQFGAHAMAQALLKEVPAYLSICSMTGRTVIDVPNKRPEPFKEPGTYSLMDESGYTREIYVDYGEDARDVALHEMDCSLTSSPIQEDEEAA